MINRSDGLLVGDKPFLRRIRVPDTLPLKQAIASSVCIVDVRNKNGPRVAAFYRTGGVGKT